MVASLVGDPARANMLTAMMTGRALTASELAHEAGITPQTASSHLAKLEAGGLIEQEKQGRHRYYRLSRSRCRRRAGRARGPCRARRPHARAHRAEGSGAAPGADLLRPSRRRSRRADARQHEGAAAGAPEQAGDRTDLRGPALHGEALQIDADRLAHPRRPVCKACLDWSERRHHLAGTLGAAMMNRFTELKWAARDATPGSRVVNFSRNGEKRFAALFGRTEAVTK